VTVSVLLATTGRPDLAEACVRSLRSTTAGHTLEIVAAVDADEETRDRLEPLVDVMLYEPEYRGCSKAWNDALAACTGDPVVLAADDVEWGAGWLDATLTALEGLPDGWGMVGLHDAQWGPALSTHYAMSRRLIVEVFGGVVTWECYTHSFQDREANERAQRAGRYVWCEDARIYHQHWLWGTRAQDETDARNLGGHADSERVYSQRAAAGFPNDFAPVISS
jgi:GT2 family glycosyltransferase